MRTVNEVAKITGVSVRTLRYYDEIGLLKPTDLNEVGYRLYDDKALEVLQQILFFKEFDMPLKEIMAIMKSPEFDKTSILKQQKNILKMKRKRLDGLIKLIDMQLKGDSVMDFQVFDTTEIEDIYNHMIQNMREEQKNTIQAEYGDMENYKASFIKKAGGDKAQKNYQKIVEWYGSKEKVLETVANPVSKEVIESCQKRIEEVYKKLAACKEMNVNDFEVRKIIGELDFASKMIYQMEDVTNLLLEMAELYQKDKNMIEYYNSLYGEGTAEFFGEAIKAFYNSNQHGVHTKRIKG